MHMIVRLQRLGLLFLLASLENALASSSKEINRCRSCVQISKEVENRVEKTGKKGGQVSVGKRFGPNGETIHKKVIDYADSYTFLLVPFS